MNWHDFAAVMFLCVGIGSSLGTVVSMVVFAGTQHPKYFKRGIVFFVVATLAFSTLGGLGGVQ